MKTFSKNLVAFLVFLVFSAPLLPHGHFHKIELKEAEKNLTQLSSTQYIYPKSLYGLDPKYTHHVIVVEKSTHLIHLFKYHDGRPIFQKSYPAATGQKQGDKQRRNDLKTPEGVYTITEFLPERTLIKRYGDLGKQYGAGAFVLNYPNYMDKKQGKTGHGIWLHSTDDESRIAKGLDSKGCAVLGDQDIKDISKYVELGKTNVIIVQDLNLLSKTTWQTNKQNIMQTVKNWHKSWASGDINAYLSHYDQANYRDPIRGNYRSFANYKRGVFSRVKDPQIQLSHISILSHKHYALVQFEQHYQSNTIDDVGRKYLYLQQDDNYQWKIVGELWRRLSDEDTREQMAFNPTMRFFKDSSNESDNQLN